MKTIKNSKDITTLEVNDAVVFGNLEYVVTKGPHCKRYYLVLLTRDDNDNNDKIFEVLNINRIDFIEKLGINAKLNCPFPETKSLEALTAIVSALFKEYEKQNELPKTWEEFCERHNIIRGESYIDISSSVSELDKNKRDSIQDRNVCTSQQEAKAFLALMQLRQLRKAYVKNWEPDWEDEYKVKYVINYCRNELVILEWYETSCTLSFPTEKLAEQFLNNFKDLLEIAKPLL